MLLFFPAGSNANSFRLIAPYPNVFVGFELQILLELGGRFVHFSLFEKCEAEVVPRVRVVGPDLQGKWGKCRGQRIPILDKNGELC